MTNSRTAVIIGGGVAGPVTAMALLKAGIEATVYEAYPTAADGLGGQLTVAPNGLAALAINDRRRGSRDVALVAAVLASTAVAYLLSRTTGLPGLTPEAEPVDGLGMFTTLAELVDQLLGHLAGHRRDQDAVEGGPVRRAQHSLGRHLDRGAGQLGARHASRRLPGELRDQLDAQDEPVGTDEVRQDRGRPPRPGAHVEDNALPHKHKD